MYIYKKSNHNLIILKNKIVITYTKERDSSLHIIQLLYNKIIM